MKRLAVFLALVLVVVLVSVPAHAAVGTADESGGFLSGLWGAIQWLLEGIMDGLKRLFIPSDGYFQRVQDDLNRRFSAKFGNIKTLLDFLQDRFSNMRAYKNSDSMLTLQYPQDHIWSGAKIDLLLNAGELLTFIRAVVSGFIALSTAFFVYHRVKEMINT